MAKTAIVNPRAANGRFTKRRRRSHGGKRRRSRRRNPAHAGGDRSYNPRRRRRSRRRNPAAAPASSAYSSQGYRRKPNPSSELFDFDQALDIIPAGTAGIWATRFACKMAGDFEDDKPGFKHAIAMALGARVGANLAGSVLGEDKTQIAYIGGLSFLGDLFLRRNMFADSEWVRDNLMLAGVDDLPEAELWDQDFAGFESQSALGDDDGGEMFIGPDGTIYQLSGVAPDPARMPGGVGGFESTSQLGGVPSSDSSFGYVR